MDDALWDLVGLSVASNNSDSNSDSDRDENKNENKPEKNTQKKKINPINAINFTPTGSKKLFITKSGAFVKFDYLHTEVGEYLKLAKRIDNYFTLRAKTVTGAIKQLRCTKMDKANRRIIVPRYGVYEILNKKYGLDKFTTISQINAGESPSRKFKWLGTQTNNQKLIADEIMANYYTKERVRLGSAGVILNLEAGQGKSYLAAYLITVLQKKTAIILHTTALIEQWVKVLQTALGETVNIGYYYAKKKKAGDIMIFIVDSAANEEFVLAGETIKALDFYNRFGFVILDECHMYSNKTALKALCKAQTPYMLGLSATPDEHADGYDKAVWWSIGPVLDASTLDGYIATSDDFSAEVHRIMYYGPSEYTKLIVNKITDMTSNAETINMICADENRNHVVINCICEGLDLGLFMFVFADRREYLTHLREMLVKQRNIQGEIVDSEEDFVRVVGGDKSTDLENAELKSKVIFTTYQYMGTGKSVVKMNGLVLATPRKTKMKQYINRIFRLGSDATIKRHIWDICDMKLKLSSQWSTRLLHYKSKKYTVTPEKIKYSDAIKEEGGPLSNLEIIDERGGPLSNLSLSKKEIPNTKENELKITTAANQKILSIADGLIARIRRSG